MNNITFNEVLSFTVNCKIYNRDIIGFDAFIYLDISNLSRSRCLTIYRQTMTSTMKYIYSTSCGHSNNGSSPVWGQAIWLNHCCLIGSVDPLPIISPGTYLMEIQIKRRTHKLMKISKCCFQNAYKFVQALICFYLLNIVRIKRALKV